MKFDSQRFQQVLLNIISNAIKFSDFTKNQQITVRATIVVHKEEDLNKEAVSKLSMEDEMILKVSVLDEGIGIQ